MLSADEFYEASESPGNAAASAAESEMEAGEKSNDTSDIIYSDCVTADVDSLSAPPSDGITADSFQLHENAVIDVPIGDDTENSATEVRDENMHDCDETVSAECYNILQFDNSEQINSDLPSPFDTELPADDRQCESKEDDISGDIGPSQPTDTVSANDSTHSQQLDMPTNNNILLAEDNIQSAEDNELSADGNILPTDQNIQSTDNIIMPSDGIPPADDSSTQSEAKEAIVDDYSQPEELDKALSDNCEETSCTAVPLVEEPSTADSNDDAAEFVEASTSLNPGLCADTQPITDDDMQPSETVRNVDLQQLEDEDEESKDDEQFVDSTSDISPLLQPVEGNVGM